MNVSVQALAPLGLALAGWFAGKKFGNGQTALVSAIAGGLIGAVGNAVMTAMTLRNEAAKKAGADIGLGAGVADNGVLPFTFQAMFGQATMPVYSQAVQNTAKVQGSIPTLPNAPQNGQPQTGQASAIDFNQLAQQFPWKTQEQAAQGPAVARPAPAPAPAPAQAVSGPAPAPARPMPPGIARQSGRR